MSINHYSAEGLWWGQPQYHHHHHHHTNNNMDTSTKTSSGTTTATNNSASFWGNSQFHRHSSANPSPSSLNFDLNNEDDEETVDEEVHHRRRNFKAEEEEEEEKEIHIPKEPLFEKPLTPSDVGKLNRLVIPKQHAEKYFPLNGGNDSGGEKGLLLSFEDELGKPWRFRYSYWNSSQSYVLTKGWSRFVKEKRLDAGDIVLFERHRLDGDRLFIGWRRRTAAVAAAGVQDAQSAVVGGGGGASNGWTRVYFSSGQQNNPYPAAGSQQPHHHRHGHGPGFPYQPDCLHAGGGGGGGGAVSSSVGQQQQQHNQTSSGNSKTLRLFGVNLECQPQPDEVDSDQPPQSATPPELGQQPQGYYHQFQQYYPKVQHAYFNHHNHMNINFSRDATTTTQTRYWQG